MLLNLLAALSLASVGAVAGIASNSQLADVELDKSSLIQRRNARTTWVLDGGEPLIVNYYNINENADVALDIYVPFHTSDEQVESLLYTDALPYSFYFSDTWHFGIILDVPFDSDDYDLYVNDDSYSYADTYFLSFDYDDFYGIDFDFPDDDPGTYADVSYVHILILSSSYVLSDYYSSHQIVSGIASGLTSVQHYATSLVSGFDALALDNGALTNSMAFAFTLLGIGTAVGICKLTFNWITGRRGM